MKPKPMPALYVVWALTSPGPRWRAVSEPAPRSELVLIVRDQWKLKHLARIRPAPKAETLPTPTLRESK
jgi:hypothetical protein